MEEQNLFPASITDTKVLVTIFSTDEQLVKKSLQISTMLRDEGINAELWLDEAAKMEKQLKYADQKGIPFALIIGPEEMEKNMVALRNLATREQKQINFEELLDTLSS
jgi:histidyl-tRNA synthetase